MLNLILTLVINIIYKLLVYALLFMLTLYQISHSLIEERSLERGTKLSFYLVIYSYKLVSIAYKMLYANYLKIINTGCIRWQ